MLLRKLEISSYFRRYSKQTEIFRFRFYFFLKFVEKILKNRRYFLIATFLVLQDSVYKFSIQRFVSKKPSSTLLFYMTRKNSTYTLYKIAFPITNSTMYGI